MLYSLLNLRADLVILVLDGAVSQAGQSVFTDGNAASSETLFSSDPNIVSASVDAITAEWWTDHAGGKRRRCAEVLVHPLVPPSYIKYCICSNEPTGVVVERMTDLNVAVSGGYFFGRGS